MNYTMTNNNVNNQSCLGICNRMQFNKIRQDRV